jgi:hypothetical protein
MEQSDKLIEKLSELISDVGLDVKDPSNFQYIMHHFMLEKTDHSNTLVQSAIALSYLKELDTSLKIHPTSDKASAMEFKITVTDESPLYTFALKLKALMLSGSKVYKLISNIETADDTITYTTMFY